MNLWLHLGFLALVLVHKASASNKNCDFFTGTWVVDGSYPLYNASACPFIEREFSCQMNGRPDSAYTKYRWKPLRCDLQRVYDLYTVVGERIGIWSRLKFHHLVDDWTTKWRVDNRFDGLDFLKRFRGKSIMFVGDSLSRNQWQSLTCLLHSSVPQTSYTIAREADVSTFTFLDYEVKVMLDRNVYLVDLVRQKNGRLLKLDSIEGGKLWKGVDMLIFNTWHWWNRRGPSQPWDYIQVGNEIKKDMDRTQAFERALKTWGKWVDSNIDPEKTLVFFQGISPSHYNGTLWNEPNAKSCNGQKEPVAGSTYPAGLPPAVGVLKGVLADINKPVQLLDITLLSLLRKDGHPSIYGLGGLIGMDCSHWCLAGVPDAWNLILYNLIL